MMKLSVSSVSTILASASFFFSSSSLRCEIGAEFAVPLALAEGVAANGRLGFGVTVHGLLILEGGFNPEGFGSPDELMLLVLSFLSEVFPH